MKIIWMCIVLVFSGATIAKDIIYKFKDKKYQAKFWVGKESKKTIFVVHDWDGLTDYEVKRAKMFNELGYNVFAVDIYGAGVRPTTIAENKKISRYHYANRELMRDAVQGAVKKAKELGLPFKHSALVGYCFGGTVGLELARNSDYFNQYFIFHGGLETPVGQSYLENKAKLFIYHGGADESVTIDHVAELTKVLEKEKQDYLLQIYSGAPHAFTQFEGSRYRKIADEESWLHMLKHLK